MLNSPDPEILNSIVRRVFRIDSVTLGDNKRFIVRYVGSLQEDSEQAYERLAADLDSYNITPLFRKEDGAEVVYLTSGVVRPKPSRLSINIGLFILNTLEDRDLRFIRDIPRLAAVPILVFVDRLQGLEEIEFCVQAPKVVLCNRHILHPEELRGLIDRLRRGDGSHGPPTSGLVKKAILYLNLHYASVPSRYRLADFVHVNEDYLTRIFRRELGLAPWDWRMKWEALPSGNWPIWRS